MSGNLCSDTSDIGVLACDACKALAPSCTDHFYGYSTEACACDTDVVGIYAGCTCDYVPNAIAIVVICAVGLVFLGVLVFFRRMYMTPQVTVIQTQPDRNYVKLGN